MTESGKKKNGIYTVKEEDNESEEIKTEIYLTSDDPSSSSADESDSE
jgi:hypothetical protein